MRDDAICWKCDARTSLTLICPVCIRCQEEQLTQTCHERHFPQYSLYPWSTRGHLYPPLVLVVHGRIERDMYLSRVEAKVCEVVEIRGPKERARFTQPGDVVG